MTRIEAYIKKIVMGNRSPVIAAKRTEKEIYQLSRTSYGYLLGTGMPPFIIIAIQPMW